MFRIYRKPSKGEFFLIGGDTSQGGADSNFGGALSYQKIDFPIVWDFPFTVAATVTPYIHALAVWIYKETGVPPMIALERQNGGASEMERLRVMNTHNYYRLYVAKSFGKTEGEQETEKLGWDTNSATRPKMIGDWRTAFDGRVPTIYDAATISQHKTFVTNKRGRPEAAPKKHDDAVMFSAICWQMYQTEEPEYPEEDDDDDYYSPEPQLNFMPT